MKTENETLCRELDSLVGEFKSVRSIAEQLQNDYERSKRLFISNRYNELKGTRLYTMHVRSLRNGSLSNEWNIVVLCHQSQKIVKLV